MKTNAAINTISFVLWLLSLAALRAVSTTEPKCSATIQSIGL